jgi:hypothetical protein
LDRVWIKEVLGRLNNADILLLKQPQGALQDVPVCDEVSVEQQNELGPAPLRQSSR